MSEGGGSLSISHDGAGELPYEKLGAAPLPYAARHAPDAPAIRKTVVFPYARREVDSFLPAVDEKFPALERVERLSGPEHSRQYVRA